MVLEEAPSKEPGKASMVGFYSPTGANEAVATIQNLCKLSL